MNPELTLPFLEHLDLDNSNITPFNFKILLAKARPKTIKLFRCKENLISALISDIDLSRLETLALCDNVYWQDLHKLLIQAPMLHTLVIHNVNIIFDTIPQSELSLPNLRKLTINGSKQASAIIRLLLSGAPNLKQLQLSGHFLKSHQPTPFYLPHLTECHLANYVISVPTFKNLLINSKKIKKLILSGQLKYESKPDDSNLLEMPVLEYLKLSGINLYGGFIRPLFSIPPCLTSLTIAGGKNNAHILIAINLIHHANLQNLEHLELLNSQINLASLSHLLKNTQQLKRLILQHCPNLKPWDINTYFLPHLEELHLTGSDIQLKHIEWLLAHTSRLRKLSLPMKSNLEMIDSSLINLQHLEELSCVDNRSSTIALSRLLLKTPELVAINLSNCSYINRPFDDRLYLPRLKVLDLTQSTIAKKPFTQLLASAPQAP